MADSGVLGGMLSQATNLGGRQPVDQVPPQTGIGGPTAPGNSPTLPGPRPTPAPTPPLNSLYATNPGASTFNPSDTGAATTTGAAPTAAASLAPSAATANASTVGPLAGIKNGQINPNDSTNAASQLDAITNANSPYVQLAEQQGLLSAASRGLENSSIGAGAAEAAGVAAAAPLAEQNAGAATQGMLTNAQLQTQVAEQNAAAQNAAQLQNSQLGTQASEFNASQLNANQQLNAQMQTQQTQFNAAQQQQAAATNAAAQNAMTQQVMQLNEQINQQYLSGTQSQSLASIQGQYNELIQQNASASSLYTSMLNNIGATMANKDIAPSRVADTISAMQSLLSSGLGIIDAINGGTGGAAAPPVPGGFAPPNFTNQRGVQPLLGGRPG